MIGFRVARDGARRLCVFNGFSGSAIHFPLCRRERPRGLEEDAVAAIGAAVEEIKEAGVVGE
jgi:hypothetical protein